MKIKALSFIFLFLLINLVRADVIIIKNGDVINGTVLQTNDNGILFRCDYGTVTYPPGMILRVQRNSTSERAEPIASDTNALPSWGRIIEALSKQSWAHDLRQIPATVIDKGVLKDVPYISFRCGIDYEVNIYGDLDHPAGVEIGVYRSLLRNDEAKRNCIEFIAGLFADASDKAALRGMNRDQAILTRGDNKLEITPPTAEDAYNGWWVSVYNETKLNSSRATSADLAQISAPKAYMSAKDYSAWTAQELENARTVQAASADSTDSAGDYSGGRVYVRGYFRKNGTYVNSYTRSYPSRH
jgi:hypothetical protein